MNQYSADNYQHQQSHYTYGSAYPQKAFYPEASSSSQSYPSRFTAQPPNRQLHSDQIDYEPQPGRSFIQPSDIYSRPQAPSEMEFHFRDDISTIAPDDSVSQLGRRMTNQNHLSPSKRVAGPRPMEFDETTEERVPALPHLSTDRYMGAQASSRDDERLPSPGAATRVDDEEQETLIRPVPSPAPRSYAPERKNPDDRRSSNSSIAPPVHLPFNSTPHSQRSLPSGAGYAALPPPIEDAESSYPSHQGLGGHDLSNSSRWIDPLDYNASEPTKHDPYDQDHYREGTYGLEDEKQLYAYPPVNASRSSIKTLEPLDIVERQPDAFSETPSMWSRMWYDGKTPIETRIAEHKQGLGLQKRPWACWCLAVVFGCVLIYEMVRMYQYTGSPIQTKPSFNVMIGPSGPVLINVGARFAGCQKYIANVTDIEWVCLKDSNQATGAPIGSLCTMSQICGFGGFPTPQQADQKFRFVLPIFLHAGVIHFLVNMLAQVLSSSIVEKQMGTPKFLIVYFCSGIFGFVLGSNFALVGQPSVGASGAIFGTHAAVMVDLLAHWNIEYRPVKKLIFLIIEIIIGMALGLVPGVDNFAHLGGFLMGLLMSILLLPIIHQSRRHKVIFIILRVVAAALAVVLFVVLVRNFYVGDPGHMCSWCRYLSCWPTAANNRCQGTGISTVTSTTSSFVPTIFAILVSTLVIPYVQ